MRIAFFGQAPFGREVLVRLLEAGHEIVAVYAPPAKGRPDPLAEEAEKRGLRLLRHASMRRKGAPIPDRLEEYRGLGAELNVLAFVTMILPPEIVDAPAHGSLCFHPSLLPKYRGGNALAWQIMLGETETGVTVFRPDAGVDTGPIVVQKGGVAIEAHHTAASLYFERLYDLGIEAMVEAVDAVAHGRARAVPQDERHASFQGLVDDAAARLDWSRPAVALDRWIRGCDPNPGAHADWNGTRVRFFGGRLASDRDAGERPGTVLAVDEGGLRIAAQGGVLTVAKLRVGDGPKQTASESAVAVGQRFA